MDIQDDNTSSHDLRLAILIRPGGIDTLACNDLTCTPAAVDIDQAAASSQTKTLEEAVYASPALLGDFASVDVVADTDRFVIVPAAIADDPEATAEVARLSWPDADTDNLVIDSCGTAALVSIFDRQLTSFVGRTFIRASLHHRLAMLVHFFMSQSAPVNRVKIYARFAGQKRLDIVVLSTSGLIMANSFDCEEIDDAFYFIMAVVKDCGFDALDDELIVCGDEQRCRDITDRLRVYINSVMPLVTPDASRKLPLELINFTK